jgi:hypothetical protein
MYSTNIIAASIIAGSVNISHADSLTLESLQGAWLGQESGCETTFVFRGKKPTFRRPVDAFAPAFIVNGDKVTTPLASCRIQKLEKRQNGTRVTLSCANSLSASTVVTTFTYGRGYLLRITESGAETGYYNHCKGD